MSDYYEIQTEELSTNEGVWMVRLCADADVYRGHFPGQPIAPGACNIEMIRQLASRLLERECRLREITQCRFTHLITPTVENPLRITIQVNDSKLTASVHWEQTTCITLKAILNKASQTPTC